MHPAEPAETLPASAEEAPLLRIALNIARIGEWDYESSTDVLHHSLQHDACYGYPQGAATWSPEHFLAHVHPLDRARIKRLYIKALLQGEAYEFEFRVIWPDGSLHWINSTGRFTRAADGTLLRGFGLISEITGRKIAEQMMRTQMRAIESIPQGVVIVDALADDHPIIYANQGLLRMSGYALHEILGRNCRFLQGQDRQQPALPQLRKALSSAQPTTLVLRNYRKDGSLFFNEINIAPVRDEHGEVSHFIGIQSDITEAKRIESELVFRASHDPLTRLLNRTVLEARIDEAIAVAAIDSAPVALLFIDLDHFKHYNDNYGHVVGDGILKMVAERLAQQLGSKALLARVGGDELLLALPGHGQAQAEATAQALIACLSQPGEVGGYAVRVGASIGIAVFPEHGDSSTRLIQLADLAMLQAKRSGRSTWRSFEPGMREQLHNRLALEAALRLAIEREEFVLHYQPQVALASGRTTGTEALLRWQRPEHGLLLPPAFIEVAEESGLIVPIGSWVLREACRQTAAWQAEGLGQLGVSVNVSAAQFRRPDFEATVCQALAESGLAPVLLELEITESLAQEDVQGLIQKLARLKKLGVRVAIDDFGIGYSSLNYLKKFPIDQLKIDREFVRDLHLSEADAAICRSIIGLGHNLGLTLVAEGVETLEQARLLHGFGCETAQGFLFSKAVPPERIAGCMEYPAAAV